MNICDLATSSGRLRAARKDLQQRWSMTKMHWRDQAAKRFEEQHLEPLIPRLSMAVNAVSSMGELLERMQRDCE
jgi:hypothetical protein